MPNSRPEKGGRGIVRVFARKLAATTPIAQAQVCPLLRVGHLQLAGG